MRDGDGWARCGRGHVHWGRYGAAGLLVYARDPADDMHVLLQQRGGWTPGAHTWGLPGGARDSREDAVTAALREAGEESTLDTATVRVHGVIRDDHGGWSFDTVIGSVERRVEVRAASWETRQIAWVRTDEVERLPLFPPFAPSWPRLRGALTRPVIVVDAANVVGARADGWWRDRAGATTRLRDELAGLAAAGVTGLPVEVAGLDHCYPELVLVVEGAARRVGAGPDGVRVVAAAGSGDDAIVEFVRAGAPDVACLVVTADRELRERCRAAGAAVTGPRWLLSRLR